MRSHGATSQDDEYNQTTHQTTYYQQQYEYTPQTQQQQPYYYQQHQQQYQPQQQHYQPQHQHYQPQHQQYQPQQQHYDAADGGSGTPSKSKPPVRNISAALLGGGMDGMEEPPILEELGINLQHIRAKTASVLWPRRSKLDQEVINDTDFAGPLLFCMALGFLLLCKGKVQFSSIYMVFVVGLLGLWGVFNLMSLKGIDIYRTASVMGYCLLPIVMLAALSVPLDMTGVAGIALVPTAIVWCANAAALFFVVILEADDQRWLLAYPVVLFYTCFALITIY